MSANTTINQRIGQLIQQLGLNKNAFALSLGKTASVIQHLMDGRNKPGYDLLCKVFEVYPNVSRDWLMLGKGPMLLPDAEAPKEDSRPVAEAAPAAAATQEALDFDEPVIPAPRRPAAGSPLQPADIAATLALAASAAGPARTSVPLPAEAPAAASPTPPAPELPAPAPAPVAPVAPAPVAAAAPDASLALALQTQHLQHQLALAELRNQHLLEQQQMLREMLALVKKAV